MKRMQLLRAVITLLIIGFFQWTWVSVDSTATFKPVQLSHPVELGTLSQPEPGLPQASIATATALQTAASTPILNAPAISMCAPAPATAADTSAAESREVTTQMFYASQIPVHAAGMVPPPRFTTQLEQ